MSAPLQAVQAHLTTLIGVVDVDPGGKGGLPGMDAFQKLLNGGARYALLACLLAFLIGAAQWGFGTHNHNYSHASDGRERMLKAAGGAFGIGAVAAVINFFYNAGTGVH